MNPSQKHLRWRKPSYSGGTNGNCVEVATEVETEVETWHVRDSKNPGGPVLSFDASAWAQFVALVKTAM